MVGILFLYGVFAILSIAAIVSLVMLARQP